MPRLRKSLQKSRLVGPLLAVLFLPAIVLGNPSDQEKTLFSFLNAERAREREQKLEWDDALYQAAVAHSNDMAGMNKVTHDDSEGLGTRRRVANSGIFASQCAENVARDINIVSAHTSLMESVYHRNNILNPVFDHGAVAIVQKGNFLYVTELFATVIPDYTIDKGRYLLLDQINSARERKGLSPARLSEDLITSAQSRAEAYARQNSLDPLSKHSIIGSQTYETIHVTAYTTGNLESLSEELDTVIFSPTLSLGIGLKRVRGPLCDLGCYLITLFSQ